MNEKEMFEMKSNIEILAKSLQLQEQHLQTLEKNIEKSEIHAQELLKKSEIHTQELLKKSDENTKQYIQALEKNMEKSEINTDKMIDNIKNSTAKQITIIVSTTVPFIIAVIIAIFQIVHKG